MPGYNQKMIKSGKVIEIYNYENKVQYGYLDENKVGRIVCDNKENKRANREKVVNRAKRNIRRLANCNIQRNSKFVTLTFKDNITDLDIANYEFKKFIQRLKYKTNIDLKYLAVIEFQERGAVHYHTMLFNLPYMTNSALTRVWKNGFVRINKIDNVDNVGAYLTGYLTKQKHITENEELQEDKLLEKKCYFTSKNLKQPIEILKDTMYEKKLSPLEKDLNSLIPKYIQSFKNEYNSVDYKQYILPN